MSAGQKLFRRYTGNPILTPEQWPYTVNAVFNPGVVKVGEDTLLLVRVEDRSGISHLGVARSPDGYTNWAIEPEGGDQMLPGHHGETWGIEDPRITQCGEEYMIVYTGFSRGGPLVCLAVTRDFRTFERRGIIMPPDDKDAALLPCRFNDRWALLHRPSSGDGLDGHAGSHIWLSWSPDLRHWGDHEVLVHARQGGWWDANKIGLGPPPLLTDYGWLIFYHGVRETAAGAIYRVGLALLDRNDPGLVIMRGNEWIFGPETEYERSGDVPGVVFPCGWVLEDDGRTIRLYYGAADTSVCVASGDLEEIVGYLHRHCICGKSHELGECCSVAPREPIRHGPAAEFK